MLLHDAVQVPANYAALSPDGRLLASVGDSTIGNIHMATESGEERLQGGTEVEKRMWTR
jgi:hypothetical protein